MADDAGHGSGTVATGGENKDLTKTVAKHYNDLKESGLEARTQSRIFYMRNFNNWIKSMMINDYLTRIRDAKGSGTQISVLDLCAGKGGDLLKWKKGRIDKLVCADIAATSVEQCENRFKDMMERGRRDRFQEKMYTAQFIAADCTKKRLKDLYKDPDHMFDLVSCQFSFHYCFESLPQAEMMLRNAGECLRPGGYFIGTTPCSNELVKRLQASETSSFGNEVYRITFEPGKKSNFPLFGCQYNFHLEGVVDCPEFLVYFPLLEKLAEKFGLKLIYKKSFAEFFTEFESRGDGRGLLGRMQALEPYPPEENVDLMSKESDAYTNTHQHLEKLKADAHDASEQRRKPVKVGTLSKAEWEAVTIYLVYAFQKISDDPIPVPSPEAAVKRTHGEDIETAGPVLEKIAKTE